MKAYAITLDEDQPVLWAGTMANVKAILHDRDAYWPFVRVQECSVQSDKDGFLSALNGTPVVISRDRTWRGTSRKGLKETL